MKQDIFTQVGKRTPYRTPEGFFAGQEQLLKDKVTMYKAQRKPLYRKSLYAAAASIILIGGVYGITRFLVHPSTVPSIYASDSAPIYSRTSSSADDWSDFAEADI